MRPVCLSRRQPTVDVSPRTPRNSLHMAGRRGLLLFSVHSDVSGLIFVTPNPGYKQNNTDSDIRCIVYNTYCIV